VHSANKFENVKPKVDTGIHEDRLPKRGPKKNFIEINKNAVKTKKVSLL
jgi:hypothetical protein